MNKGERQHGMACTVCGKALASLKQAETHIATKSHKIKQKVHVQYNIMHYMYVFTFMAVYSTVPVRCIHVYVNTNACVCNVAVTL